MNPEPMRYDLIVIGAGPAGASAAIEAAKLGLRTLLLEEQPAAGGQVWRAPDQEPDEPKEGEALRAALRASTVRCAFGHRVWHVEHGFSVAALGPDGPESFAAPGLIVATGAQERHVPVPGWDRHGVIGLAAATILLKSARVLPGRRVVVAGTGPLLPLVAAAIIDGGGRVAAVVDANRRRDWLRRPATLLARPRLAARGAGWIAKLVRARVPLLPGHALRRIEGSDAVDGVVAGPVGRKSEPRAGTERRFDCDAVCYGFGLQPATEITRLLGAVQAWQPTLGGWSPRITGEQATSVPGLYACGDGAGVLGVAAAPLRGQVTAIAAARDLGHLDAARAAALLARLQRALRNAARFGAAMTALAMPRPGIAAAITPATIVCRCERLSRAALEAAVAEGAVTLNDLKSATRCGMGPCGGRLCEYAAALLIAARTGRGPEAIGQATARPPLRPVPMGALTGSFEYESLAQAEPAPL